jgi:hypothetical protein
VHANALVSVMVQCVRAAADHALIDQLLMTTCVDVSTTPYLLVDVRLADQYAVNHIVTGKACLSSGHAVRPPA